MDWILKLPGVGWLVSGFMLGIGFLYPFFWPLGLVGGAYFIWLIHQEEGSLKKLLLGAWLSWSIKAAISLSYLWTIYPIEWLPVELGKIQLVLIGSYWLVSSLSLGLGGLILALIIRHSYPYLKSHQAWYGLVLPLLWVWSEIFGSVAYSIVMYGPGGSVNPVLSFSYGGYLLANQSFLLSLASVAGVYGLSILFAAASLVLLQLLDKKMLPKTWLVTALILVVFVSFGTKSKISNSNPLDNRSDSVTIGIIDTKFSGLSLRNRAGRESIHNELNIAVTEALAQNSDYIILPEDSRFFDQSRPASINRSLFQLQHNDPTTVIVDTSLVEVNEKTLLQTFLYTGPNQSINQVHKRYLVPQGEFVSYWLFGALKLTGFGVIAELTTRNLSNEVGPNTDQSNLPAIAPGVLFCFESVSPIGVRTLMQERPDLPFVAHPISHAWFHEPESFWHQLNNMLMVQAVWNDTYIVSAGNMAAGQVYTPAGKMFEPQVIASGSNWQLKEVELVY